MGLVIIFLFLFPAMLILIYAVWYGISPMPTNAKVRRILLDAIPSGSKGIILEIGFGWGTLLFPLARRFPNHQIIGYEGSPIPWLFSQVRCLFFPCSNVTLIRKDFFQVSFSEANIIVCYLGPKAMKRLQEKFKNELRPGTQIFTHTFSLREWKHSRVYDVDDLYRSKIYQYSV